MSYNYRVTPLPDECILLLELGPRYNVSRDQISATCEMQAALDAAGGPTFLLMDLHELRISFEDLMRTFNFATRGEGNILHHPNIGGIAAVTNNPTIQLAGKGLNSEIFGYVNIAMFNGASEGLAYAREKAAVHA